MYVQGIICKSVDGNWNDLLSCHRRGIVRGLPRNYDRHFVLSICLYSASGATSSSSWVDFENDDNAREERLKKEETVIETLLGRNANLLLSLKIHGTIRIFTFCS